MSKIQVHQDLTLTSNTGNLATVRKDLIRKAQQTSDWQHDTEAEGNLKSITPRYLVFRYTGNLLDRGNVFFTGNGDSYKLANVIIDDNATLNESQKIIRCNKLIQNLEASVAKPAEATGNFTGTLTDEFCELTKWTTPEIAGIFEEFSANGNKKNANLPNDDDDLWQYFINEAQNCDSKIPTDILVRWLVEVDGWNDDAAADLGVAYDENV